MAAIKLDPFTRIVDFTFGATWIGFDLTFSVANNAVPFDSATASVNFAVSTGVRLTGGFVWPPVQQATSINVIPFPATTAQLTAGLISIGQYFNFSQTDPFTKSKNGVFMVVVPAGQNGLLVATVSSALPAAVAVDVSAVAGTKTVDLRKFVFRLGGIGGHIPGGTSSSTHSASNPGPGALTDVHQFVLDLKTLTFS